MSWKIFSPTVKDFLWSLHQWNWKKRKLKAPVSWISAVNRILRQARVKNTKRHWWRHGTGVISKKTKIGNCVTYLTEKWIRCCVNVYKIVKKLDSTIRTCQLDAFTLTKSSMRLAQKTFICEYLSSPQGSAKATGRWNEYVLLFWW